MLINSTRLQGCPVLSLHIGGQIASVTKLIVNPDNLKVVAVQVEGPLISDDTGDILPMASVREFSRLGMIVDSIDELVNADEIVRVRDILKLDFNLVGLKVESKAGAKLGKVSDFTIEPTGWNVQQLIVQRPFFKAFLDPELVIARDQIVEIDDYKVVIKDETDARTHQAKAKTEFTPNFINPFREPDFASESQTKK